MYRQAVAEELSQAQFKAARLGYFGVLRRKRMSPPFVEREGEDLFAQACFEFSRQLGEGRTIDNPVAWIVTCAWNRTVSLLETRDWRPDIVSTERIGELGEDDWTPEREFLSDDRYRKVREAVDHLPDYQRRLLALSYFEGESVREAGRRLGWTASKAQRAHETARRHLRKLLDVELSDDLAIEIGLAAFLSIAGGGGPSFRMQLAGGVEGALDALARPADLALRLVDAVRAPFAHGGSPRPPGIANEFGLRAAEQLHRRPVAAVTGVGRRVSELSRRFYTSGAAEQGAAAAEGGGRAAEVCKAVVAVCVLGGGAVTGALIEDGNRGGAPPTTHVRNVVAERPGRHHPSGRDRPLAAGQASEPQIERTTAEPEATAAPATHSQQQPAERHHSSEVHQAEPAVTKAKPPPSQPEGEFEPSPEASTAEPAAEAAPEASGGVATAANTASSANTGSSSSESTVKPKAVPANSSSEFEP